MSNADRLVELAIEKFGSLSETEEKLFRGVGDGVWVDLRSGDETVDHPDNVDQWDDSRKLKSDRVEWLCTESEASVLVSCKGIKIAGACFDEELDLSYARMPFLLGFVKCVFAKTINLEMASARELSFAGSHTKEICADSLIVEGWLSLQDGFRADGQVRFLCAKVGGFQCNGEFINPEGYALCCDRIKVRGGVFLHDGFNSIGQVRLLGATIGGLLNCNNGKFINPDGYALSCDGIEVKGSVFLQNGFNSDGEVRFLNASIGGSLSCCAGTFTSLEGHALSCDGAEVKGGVLLRDGFSSKGEVRFIGAMIKGNLECDNSKFVNPKGKSLNCDGIKVNGGVFLRDGFSSEGDVCFLGATIGGGLVCNNGKFINPEGYAISCDMTEIKGGVFLTDGFSSEGEIRFIGSTIGGNFECDKSRFTNLGGYTLCCETMVVKGNVFFRNQSHAEGAILFADVTVGSNVLFSNCTISDKNNVSVLDVGRAVIEGNLVFENVKFKGDVDLGGCRVKGELTWKGIKKHKPGELDLRYADVGTLNDESGSWPEQILLHGFVYKEIHTDAPRGAEKCIEWLRLQPKDKKDKFYPGPYEQLGKVLRESGHDDAAKRVLVAKSEDRVSRGESMRWYSFAGLWYKVLGPMIGYGYRPWWALFKGPLVNRKGRCKTLVGFFGSILFWLLAGCLLFGWGYYGEDEVMRPSMAKAFVADVKKDALDGDAKKDNCDVRAEYPAFQFIMYSIDTFVPVVDLRQGKYWLPNANRGKVLLPTRWFTIKTGGLLLLYTWVHIVAGWVLSTLLVLGLTGMVRK